MILDTTLLNKDHPGLLVLYTFHSSGMWASGWLESIEKLYELKCIGARFSNDLNTVRELFDRYHSYDPDDDESIPDRVYKLVHGRLYPLDSENNIDYSLPSIPVDLGTLYEIR